LISTKGNIVYVSICSAIIIKNIFRLARLKPSRFKAVTAHPVRPTHQSESPPKPQLTFRYWCCYVLRRNRIFDQYERKYRMRFDSMFSIIIKNIFLLAQLTSSRFNAITTQSIRPTHQTKTPPKPLEHLTFCSLQAQATTANHRGALK
jgi:hypothetical protein